jgi:hypothetical protein
MVRIPPIQISKLFRRDNDTNNFYKVVEADSRRPELIMTNGMPIMSPNVNITGKCNF